MSHMDRLIQNMQQSAEGQYSLGDHELRLIKSSAGKIANAMAAGGMAWEDANRIWNHVIDRANSRDIKIDMPSIPDTQHLTPEVLSGSMVHAGDWSGYEDSRREGNNPSRWL